MKKLALVIAVASFVATAPLAAIAAMEHDHGAMKMDHGNGGTMTKGNPVHQEVVDGVKTTFEFYALPGGKETHHIMVTFTDAKSGKPLTEGEVKLKVMGPEKNEQLKNLMKMGEGFGANFSMAKKGKYGVMCKFKMKDGKVRTAKFWYTVK